MDTAYHSPINIDTPSMLVLNKDTDQWQPCSAKEDFFLTFAVFLMSIVSLGIFLFWLALL